MSTAERTQAIEQMRSSATAIIKAKDSKTKGASGTIRKSMVALERAYRSFPECREDKVVPTPEEILRIVARLDRELAEAKANGWV